MEGTPGSSSGRRSSSRYRSNSRHRDNNQYISGGYNTGKKFKLKLRITTTFILLFASSGFILGLLSVPWCDYATLPITITPGDDNSFILLESTLGLGLWRHQTLSLRDGRLYIENSCSDYNENVISVDATWKASRAFGILALILGGLNLIWNGIEMYRSKRNNEGSEFDGISPMAASTQQAKLISGGIFIVASLYQGLTLFFLRSSMCNGNINDMNNANYIMYGNSGAYMNIGSLICWFVAGIICLIYQPHRADTASSVVMENQLTDQNDRQDADANRNEET